MKFLSVEAARGVAAILVVLVHGSSMLSGPRYFGTMPFDGLFRFAHAGVDFFFVLSGFIILYVHWSDLGDPAKFGRYVTRRFVRIFPVYWIVLFILGLILAVSPTRDFYERNIVAVLSNTLLIPVSNHDTILGVAWTLEHEVLFYALFSLLFFARSVGWIVLSSWAALILWNILTRNFSVFPGNFLFSMFNIHFFFGMAVAAALRRWPIFHPRLMLLLGSVLFGTTGTSLHRRPPISPAIGPFPTSSTQPARPWRSMAWLAPNRTEFWAQSRHGPSRSGRRHTRSICCIPL